MREKPCGHYCGIAKTDTVSSPYALHYLYERGTSVWGEREIMRGSEESNDFSAASV